MSGAILEDLAELPSHVADGARVYVRPILSPGSPVLAVEALIRDAGRVTRSVASIAEVRSWIATLPPPHGTRTARLLSAAMAARRPKPMIMGVVNVTPDSFSDGGDFATAEAAIAKGRAMIAEGADILDVGGESTRPGSEPVPPAEEIRRVLPVIEALAGAGVAVSIDTRNAATMRRAIAAGATIVNDVSALAHDPGALGVVTGSGVTVVLMHAQGDPRTMQKDPRYHCAPLDVFDMLEARIEACAAHGIGRDRIVVDPGIGFGKTLRHNLEILERLALFHGLGCPILLGASRKSFIGRLSKGEPPKERGPGSLAAALWGVAQGAGIVRVHDVAATAQALAVLGAIVAPERHG